MIMPMKLDRNIAASQEALTAGAGDADDQRPSVAAIAPWQQSGATRERLPDRRGGYSLSSHRRISRRPPWRDFYRHAQGRSRLPVADEQFCDRRVARPAIRRAARGVRRRLPKIDLVATNVRLLGVTAAPVRQALADVATLLPRRDGCDGGPLVVGVPGTGG